MSAGAVTVSHSILAGLSSGAQAPCPALVESFSVVLGQQDSTPSCWPKSSAVWSPRQLLQRCQWRVCLYLKSNFGMRLLQLTCSSARAAGEIWIQYEGGLSKTCLLTMLCKVCCSSLLCANSELPVSQEQCQHMHACVPALHRHHNAAGCTRHCMQPCNPGVFNTTRLIMQQG